MAMFAMWGMPVIILAIVYTLAYLLKRGIG